MEDEFVEVYHGLTEDEWRAIYRENFPAFWASLREARITPIVVKRKEWVKHIAHASKILKEGKGTPEAFARAEAYLLDPKIIEK